MSARSGPLLGCESSRINRPSNPRPLFRSAFEFGPTYDGSQMTDLELAEYAFRTYNDQGPNPWKTFDGRSVPTWDEISEQVKSKWLASAIAVRRVVTAPTVLGR